MLPVWALAGRRLRDSLGTRQVPLLALGAAFVFVIMMFNIPALGGTTAHPVAGTLVAVLLGPWAAVIGISVALAIQALFFGDGGLLAYGANCFAMAFVLPFVGYSIYSLLAGNRPSNAPVRAVCAGIGAYFGLNAAAGVVAALLGIQPSLFHEANGQALYFPFGPKVTLPAMLGTHLIVAGPAEAIVTVMVARYLQAAGYALYGAPQENAIRVQGLRRERLWIGLLALAALSPLGLLASGDAWGEWDAEGLKAEIKRVEGREYVPQGVAKAEETGYKGLGALADYAGERGATGYILAALLGIGAVSALAIAGGRLLARREEDDSGRGGGGGAPPMEEGAESNSLSDLPDWMRRPSEETTPAPDTSGHRPNPFLERTLAELTGSAAATLAGEQWARQPGYLQRLDARAKLPGFLALIVVVSCIRNPVTLLLIYALALALAVASRLPVGMLLRRVWLSTLTFVGVLALPAALNLVTPGRPLLVLWTHPALSITEPGLFVALLLPLRVGIAVSLATLLTLTTGWNDLLRALRTFFVPKIFLSVLAMTYRYILVLLQTAAEMFVARRSRTVGRTTNRAGRQFVGARIGALFGKSLALSEEVHAAMLARGYTGEARTLAISRWQSADTLWLVLIAAASALALMHT